MTRIGLLLTVLVLATTMCKKEEIIEFPLSGDWYISQIDSIDYYPWQDRIRFHKVLSEKQDEIFHLDTTGSGWHNSVVDIFCDETNFTWSSNEPDYIDLNVFSGVRNRCGIQYKYDTNDRLEMQLIIMDVCHNTEGIRGYYVAYLLTLVKYK
jgi:hypothetical protein